MPPKFRSSAIAAFHNIYEAVNVQINGYTFARGEWVFPTVHWKKDNFVNFFLPLNHFFWIPIENLGILGAVKVHFHPPFVKFSQIFGIF